MEGPLLGPGGEDITWPDQVAPRGRKASSTRKIKPQTSNLKTRSIQNIPNAIPDQHDHNKQEQRQSKEDTKKITMSTSESLLTVWGRRAVAETPPFLFLHGSGSLRPNIKDPYGTTPA